MILQKLLAVDGIDVNAVDPEYPEIRRPHPPFIIAIKRRQTQIAKMILKVGKPIKYQLNLTSSCSPRLPASIRT